jgi:ferric-dicitrate binding protein FerR (iron transport regulator)
MHQNNYDKNYEQQRLEGEISSEEFLSNHDSKAKDSPLVESLVAISDFDAPSKRTKQQAWELLESTIASEAQVVPFHRKYRIGIAASIILAIGAFFFLKETGKNDIIIRTALAEVQSVYLPDSSVVHLNAESELTFSEEDWKLNRKVNLKGEAFFEVKKGSDFSVKTRLGTVKVLGTLFNVKVRNNILEVACKTGSVEVSNSLASQKAEITPGWAVKVKNDVIQEITPLGFSYIDNWRRGEFDFESVMLSEVLEELKRQFGLTVVYDIRDIEDRPYTGFFDKENLNEALQLICNTMGLSYKIEENTVTIKNKQVQNQ